MKLPLYVLIKTKHYFPFIFFFLSFTLSAQQRDTRAELKIDGSIDEISVSPEGRIWLVTANGKTYYTAHIDSSWHYGPSFAMEESYSVNAPHLERISFFNNDNAIITGYISVNDKNHRKNGYYITKDGGKNWQLRDYGGNSWI